MKKTTADLKAYKRAMRNATLKDLKEGRKNRGGYHTDRKKEQSRTACRGKVQW